MPRFSLVTVAVFACAACGGPPALLPPATDSCSTAPGSATVDTLVLGAAHPADLSDNGFSGFTPLHDGDGMQLIHGGQGATMLGFGYTLSGANAPACLAQQLVVTDSGGGTVTISSLPLNTYADPDGARETHDLWLPAAYPSDFVVSASAGGQSLTLNLHLLQ